MTRVVHCKKEYFDVMIDRTTKFGNPFKVDIHGTRKEVIELFRKYFYNKPELMELAKKELYGKILGCWCNPLACHGDVYVEFLERK